jgi:hypothetical protein
MGAEQPQSGFGIDRGFNNGVEQKVARIPFLPNSFKARRWISL